MKANLRAWDIAASAVVVAMAAFAFVEPGLARPGRLLLVAIALVMLAAAYVGLVRRLLAAGDYAHQARALVAMAIIVVSVFVGVMGAPMLATVQVIAYPLVWMLTSTTLGGVLGSAAVALAAVMGFGLGGYGESAGDTWARAFVIGALSFVFAVVMGLWITHVMEHGHKQERLVADLTAAQSEIERLSADRGATAERERLARDIHDTVAQSLAGLVMLAERAGRQSREGRSDAAVATIGDVEQIAREALAESRALVAATAAVPAGPALTNTLGRLVERFRAEAGLEIELAVHTETADIGRDAQVVLLRCAQEALANVRKHAGASHVLVELSTDSRAAELNVTDNGVGFDHSVERAGFGLDGMIERVALAGGDVHVTTSTGAGTAVRVRVPVEGALSEGVL